MHNIISPLVYSLLTLALVCGDASAANAPAAVTRLAETYVASHPDATQSPASPTREETYARYFFIGLTSQNGGIWNAPELETAAYYIKVNPTGASIPASVTKFLPVTAMLMSKSTGPGRGVSSPAVSRRPTRPRSIGGQHRSAGWRGGICGPGNQIPRFTRPMCTSLDT